MAPSNNSLISIPKEKKFLGKNNNLILKKQTVPITPTIYEYFEDEELKNEIKEIVE